MYREEGQLAFGRPAKNDCPAIAKIRWNDQPDGIAGPPGVVAGVVIFFVTTVWVLLIGGVLVWSLLPAKAVWPVSIAFGVELVGVAASLGYVIWMARRS
ncbi:hypothetical protein SAZ10_32000 [Mesorhizobium sp. BAC0120]|uniref:hypothetical protein n=1 Tax=Mesorhizobium sp. BAC0120 TaxID=3090670 RepID=UPI00298C95A2|nr:hypothetical protein [Mesorhizobium sp. BAC0120]MDW6026393.1 hypothetical protein [Mesorhizobium sp. BAC0120]